MARLFESTGGVARVQRNVLRRVLERAAQRIVRRLEETAPVSTGRSGPLRRGEVSGNASNGEHLKDTFKYRFVGDAIEIVSEAPHILPVAEGSVPHSITGSPWLYFPVRAKIGGSKLKVTRNATVSKKHDTAGEDSAFMIAVRNVSHPGHARNPFLDKVRREVPRILSEELNRATK